MVKETIFLGCDHRGFKLKEALKQELIKKKIDIIDFTPDFIDGDDFTEPAKKVAQQVQKGKGRGILICGTGLGMSIAANRFKGIYATLVDSIGLAELSRSKDGSNILVLRGNFTSPRLAKNILLIWLKTKFLGGRHKRRLNKID